jgi:hypothetical protein
VNTSEQPPSPSASTHSRRHSRLHSRNLSIFFPRPGSLPHSAIAEDGAQELLIEPHNDASAATGVPMPSASPTLSSAAKEAWRRLHLWRASSTNPEWECSDRRAASPCPRLTSGAPPQTLPLAQLLLISRARLYWTLNLTSQPTPIPVSPWASTSSSLQSAGPSTIAFPRAHPSRPRLSRRDQNPAHLLSFICKTTRSLLMLSPPPSGSLRSVRGCGSLVRALARSRVPGWDTGSSLTHLASR